MLVVLHSLPSTNPTCVLPLVILSFQEWLDGVSKSLVRYDLGFHDLNLQNNLRVLRQLQYLHLFDIRH